MTHFEYIKQLIERCGSFKSIKPVNECDYESEIGPIRCIEPSDVNDRRNKVHEFGFLYYILRRRTILYSPTGPVSLMHSVRTAFVWGTSTSVLFCSIALLG